jgi:hypothetical protein
MQGLVNDIDVLVVSWCGITTYGRNLGITGDSTASETRQSRRNKEEHSTGKARKQHNAAVYATFTGEQQFRYTSYGGGSLTTDSSSVKPAKGLSVVVPFRTDASVLLSATVHWETMLRAVVLPQLD